MKRVVILQPGYIPWLGFFDQLDLADVFVIYDDVQYDKRGWRNRNRVKGPNGIIWLTVPVYQKGKFEQRIYEVKIDNTQKWVKKHLNTLMRCYKKAPFFDLLYPELERILRKKQWEFLIDLDMEIIYKLKEILKINTPILMASDICKEGGKTTRLINICKKLNATHYLTGDAAKNYIEEEKFKEANIVLEYHGYEHPEYPQRFGEFIPYLSVVDLIFNCGDKSLSILTSRGKGRF